MTSANLTALLLTLIGSTTFAQELPPPVQRFAPPVRQAQVLNQDSPPPGSARQDPGYSVAQEELARRQIRLEPPAPEQLFRLESEDELEERLRQEAFDEFKLGQSMEFTPFPELPPLTDQEFQPRMFPRQAMLIEPSFVNYGRLYFEDLSHERYGWDYGFFQPLISTSRFFKDLVFLPHNAASQPFCHYESNAGYCLPGDPVPYMMYPPEISVLGLGAQAGVVLGLGGIFP